MVKKDMEYSGIAGEVYQRRSKPEELIVYLNGLNITYKHLFQVLQVDDWASYLVGALRTDRVHVSKVGGALCNEFGMTLYDKYTFVSTPMMVISCKPGTGDRSPTISI